MHRLIPFYTSFTYISLFQIPLLCNLLYLLNLGEDFLAPKSRVNLIRLFLCSGRTVSHPAKLEYLLSEIKHRCVSFWYFRYWHLIFISLIQMWMHSFKLGTLVLVIDFTFALLICKGVPRNKYTTFNFIKGHRHDLSTKF